MSDPVGVTKAAKLIGFSDRQVREWCKDGKLEGAYQFQHNGKWLIPLSTLDRIRRVQTADNAETA